MVFMVDDGMGAPRHTETTAKAPANAKATPVKDTKASSSPTKTTQSAPASDAKVGAASTSKASAASTSKAGGASTPKQQPVKQEAPVDDAAPKAKAPPDKSDASTLDATSKSAKKKLLAGQKKAQKDAQKIAALAHHTGEDPVAMKHEVLADYYKSHSKYVDPNTGKVFNVTYDAKTGTLHGIRTNDAPISDPGAASTPIGGLAEIVTKMGHLVAHGASGSAHQEAPRKTSDSAPQTPPKTSDSTTNTPPKRSEPAKIPVFAAPTYTTELTLDDVGTSTITQDSQSTSDDGTTKTTLHRALVYEAPGVPSSFSTRTVVKQNVAGGTNTTSTLYATDAKGHTTDNSRTETKVRGNATYTKKTIPTFDADGKMTSEKTSDDARENGVHSNETHTVSYDSDGRKTTDHIVRTLDSDHAELFGFKLPLEVTASQTDDVTYNTSGDITGIKSSYAPGHENDLNNTLEALEPSSDTKPRFAFGVVESRPDKNNPTHGIVSSSGAAITHNDVVIQVEGASAADPIPDETGTNVYPGANGDTGTALTDAQKFDQIEQEIDDTPDQILNKVHTVRLISEDGKGAAAWSSGPTIVMFDNNSFNEPTFWHEAGHSSGVGGGAPDNKQWVAAAQSDKKNREEVVAKIPPGSTVTGIDHDILNDQLGLDNYGNTAITDQRTTEDWAQSVASYLQSQRDGGLVDVTEPDGTTYKLTFQDLFPERAKIIAKYYDNFDGWTPPPANEHHQESDLFPLN